MNNYYKKMFVLSEDEYIRLKQQQKVPPTDDTLQESINELSAPTSTLIVEEPKTCSIATSMPLRVVNDVSQNAPTEVEESKSVTANQPPPPSLLPSSTYKCLFCTKAYKHRRDLRRHVKLVHGVAPPTKVVIPHSLKVAKIEKKHTKIVKFAVFEQVKKWMTMHD